MTKEEQVERLRKQISQAEEDGLYLDYSLKRVKEQMADVTANNRTDAYQKIIMLLELAEEQANKHNGILKRKITSLKRQLNKVKNQ